MIGILCKNNKENKYATCFKNLFKEILDNRKISIIIFTIKNLNLDNRKVTGSLLHENKIIQVETKLPSVVYNLSIQYKKDDIRKLRNLIDIYEVKSINESNRLNQLMILKMLKCLNTVEEYMLPFQSLNRENLKNVNGLNHSLIFPRKGTSTKKLILVKNHEPDYEVLYKDQHQFYNSNNIHEYLQYIMNRKKWIKMDFPEDVAPEQIPTITRFYVQKDKDGIWEVIGSKRFTRYKSSSYEKISDNVTLKIIKHLNHFLPDMGICFLDFTINKQGKPYFLHFGGWDYRLLKKNPDHITDKLCTNIIKYADYLERNEV